MKITTKTRNLAGASLALAAAFGLGYASSRARAAGIPQTTPLTYSGVLTDANGVPMTGTANILLQLHTMPTGGTALCGSQPTAVKLSGGAFQVPLDASCTDIVRSNPDLYIDVLVGGASVGRTKLGAVPYAIEATHAVSADTATNATNATTATGALNTRIAALESSAITKLDVVYATASDAFHGQCAGNALYCGVMANRKCTALGYRAGWFLGETPDGFASIAVVCMK